MRAHPVPGVVKADHTFIFFIFPNKLHNKKKGGQRIACHDIFRVTVKRQNGIP